MSTGLQAAVAADAAGVGARLRQNAVLLAIAAAYLTIFPYFRALENPNENVRIWATRALAHHGTWSLAPVLHEWGDVTDTAIAKGQRLSSKAPGTTLLGVPVHAAHDGVSRLLVGRSPSLQATTWALRVFTVILPLLAFLWVFARRVEHVTGSPFARDLLTLGLGLGTMMYPYGLAFVGHAQSAALLFGGYLLLVPVRRTVPSTVPRSVQRTEATNQAISSRGRLVAAGGLAGLSVCFEYQAALGAVALAGFALVQLRGRVVWFVAGALLPAVLLGLYHAHLFGGPFELPYAHLDDPGYAAYHHSQGFLGLGRPRARVLRSAFVSVDYGLFVYSPFLIGGAVAAAFGVIKRGSRDQALVLTITAVMAVFLSGMANWRGGWCAAGPRYIAVVVPFLAYAVALGWQDLLEGRRWRQVGLVAAVLLSVALCSLSGLFPHFPVQLDNPIFDLVVPLVGSGLAPHGLGTAVGLRGLPALVPWAIAVLVAIALVVRQMKVTRGDRAIAVVAAALLLFGVAMTGKHNTREDIRVRAFIESLWEPARPVSRATRLPEEVRRGAA
jgi:hypothetical protein